MITNRLQNIEFLRFLFAIIIVLYHGGFATDDAYLAVEMFFILAGYFFALSWNKYSQMSYPLFIKNKLLRLWPLFAMAVIIAGGNIYDMIFKLLFLHATGITLKYKTFIWFVAPFFWSLLFYFVIFKNLSYSKSVPLIAILVYISYVFLINWDQGNLNIRETVNHVYSLAMLRGIAGIGLGILLWFIFQKISMSYEITKVHFVLVSLMEFGLLFFFVYYMVFNSLKYDNKFIFILFFALELFLFVQKQGVLSKFLDNKYSELCGRYAYAIYIMQAFGFKLSEKINFGYQLLNQIIIIVLLGVIGYHFVEKPIYRKMKVISKDVSKINQS